MIAPAHILFLNIYYFSVIEEISSQERFVRAPVSASKGKDAPRYFVDVVIPAALRAAMAAPDAAVLVVCNDGEGVSAAIAIAVLVARASAREGASAPSKAGIQRAQVALQQWAPAARPPRRLLKQLSRFFCSPSPSGGTAWQTLGAPPLAATARADACRDTHRVPLTPK